ncbi:MAG: DUF2839 domain-containing protein [Cyanobacteria bacterium]|nr:DUF2839 domain-containing protein [Cyanobacteria bacterium CG_2015-16_32_12]NCO76850.1 DUF2839 domain-containing protein [Cyanobacteria bacterium CG_2015-22_32_23]NCQ03568.1 DUF2839 domain-containing protein [Cyanobacteria bacterium CG_2015-09_32_10]
MGESKRRKRVLGEDYGKEERFISWLPLTKTQAEDAYNLTTRGAWIGIALLAFGWITIRFIGPTFGWWEVN